MSLEARGFVNQLDMRYDKNKKKIPWITPSFMAKAKERMMLH